MLPPKRAEANETTMIDNWGGFTIEYTEGPKRGLAVHFFSQQELIARMDGSFSLIMPPYEVIMPRTPPKSGTWAQWEAVWQKT